MAPRRLIVVDSSVWVDFFNGIDNEQVAELESLIYRQEPVGLVELSMTEVLRGCVSEEEADTAARKLLSFPLIEISSPNDHVRAAKLYRDARSSGVTVKGSVDLLVASKCIEYDAFLLHKDKDFDNLARVSDLKIWNPAP